MDNDILLYLLKKDRAFQYILWELESRGMRIAAVEVDQRSGSPVVWGTISNVKAMAPGEATDVKGGIAKKTGGAVKLLIYEGLGGEDMRFEAIVRMKGLEELGV